jgi:uncharacterized protein (TIGR00251 family)
VSPGSARTIVTGRHGDAWKVRVAAPPEHGRANKALLELVAETLGAAPSSLELVSGAASRDKVVLAHGISSEEADARFAEAAGGTR